MFKKDIYSRFHFKIVPKMYDGNSSQFFKPIYQAKLDKTQKLFGLVSRKKWKEKSWPQVFKLLILNITGQMDVGIYFHTSCVLTFISI